MRIERKDFKKSTCDLLQSMEEALSNIPELSGLVVSAERSSFLDDNVFPSKKDLDDFRKAPASYRNSDNTIYINERILEAYEDGERKAILAHEIGHAYQNLIGERRVGFEREVDADYQACKWGFEEALTKERGKSEGSIYAEILKTWRDEADFLARIRRFRRQKNFGVATDGLVDDAEEAAFWLKLDGSPNA